MPLNAPKLTDPKAAAQDGTSGLALPNYEDLASGGRTSIGYDSHEHPLARPGLVHVVHRSPVYENEEDGKGHGNLGYEYDFSHNYVPAIPRTSLLSTPFSASSSHVTRRQSSLKIGIAPHDEPEFNGPPPDPPKKDFRGKVQDFKDTARDTFFQTKDDLVERLRHDCTMKLLYKRVPILQWLPKYTTDLAIADLVAGFTVGLTVLPQAIAFANVAGVPPQNGLYSSFFGCFIYTIFGSCYTTAFGPTALQSILTRGNALAPDFAILLCFFSGLTMILMGILQLGFIIDFISGPVSIGFTSAAAVIIITTQIKDLLGIKVGPGQFLDIWKGIAANIHTTTIWDPVLGVICLIALFLLKNLVLVQIGPKDMHMKSTFQKIVHHTFWLISMARNIVVVVLCSVAAYLFQSNGLMPFKLTGNVKPGLPEFKPPPFTTVYQNRTYGFMDMANTLSSGTFVLAIIGIVEDIATAKVFANGKAIDATQEMLTIGVGCVLSSFVGAMPITGSLSRGAVNAASGVKTTFGGIYTGILVLLALAFLTPYFFYIPKTSLAAVIVMAVYAMVEYEIIKPIWKTKKRDLLPALATFFCCLFVSLEIGIIIGVVVNVLFLLWATARPKVSVEHEKSISGYEYLLATPDRALQFPSVEYVRNLVSKAAIKQGLSTMPVVVDASHIQGVDYTAAKGVKALMADFGKRNQILIFFNLKPSIIRSFKAVNPPDFKHCNTLQDLDDILRDNQAAEKPSLVVGKPS